MAFSNNWFRSIVLLGLLLWPSSFAAAAIQVENTSENTISVWLQGASDQKYRGPFSVQPGKTIELPVPAGRYYVAVRGSHGYQYPGWADYTNHRITYRLETHYIPAAPAAGGGGGEWTEPKMEISVVPSADSRCGRCGFQRVRRGLSLRQ